MAKMPLMLVVLVALAMTWEYLRHVVCRDPIDWA